MRVHSFDLGAEQMKALLPQVDALTSIALRQDSGAGSILRRVLDELIEASSNLDDEMSDRIADAVPGRKPDTVEPQQARVGRNPDVAVVVLANGVHGAKRDAVALGPGGQRITTQQIIRMAGIGRREGPDQY